MPPCCPCRVIASVRAAFVSFGFLTAVVLRDRGFQALEMADAQECHVCMSDLLDGSPVTSLACGHTFHDYFLNQISQVKLVAVSDGAFECPTCRVTNAQATAVEVALAAAAPASGAAAASAPAPAPAAVPASAAAPPAAAKAPALPPPDAATAWAYMESVGYASLVTTANLEAQQKAGRTSHEQSGQNSDRRPTPGVGIEKGGSREGKSGCEVKGEVQSKSEGKSLSDVAV